MSYINDLGLIYESLITIDKFTNQLLGAFRVVFDLDSDEINSKKFDKPDSYYLGIRDYAIKYDWRVHQNARNALTVYFPFLYNNKTYDVSLRIHEWDDFPPKEDLEDIYYGYGLKDLPIEENPIETTSIFTVTGSVREYIKEPDLESGGYYIHPQELEPELSNFLIEDSDLSKLASKIKEIIDNRGNDYDEDPDSTPTPTKTNTLVGV